MSTRELRPMGRVPFLQSSSLFLDLHADEIALLAELCQDVSFDAGEVIFRELDQGDSLYIIEDGEVEVLQEPEEPGKPPQVIATLGRGEFFGEMSMLERSTRSATIRTRSRVQVLMLTTEDFFSFAKIFKNGFTVVIINIARILSQRLRQTTGRLRAQ